MPQTIAMRQLSDWQRYAVAVIACAVAGIITIPTLVAIQDVHAIAALLAAILFTGWYAGLGPALLAVALCITIDRTLPELLHHPQMLPATLREIWFVLFAIGAAHVGAKHRRAVHALYDTNERLEREVALRTEELRREREYLAKAQRLSHTGCWALPAAGDRFSFWSEETYRIFGLPWAATPPDREFFRNMIHPQDLERARLAWDEAIRAHQGWDVEHRIIRPDGHVRYVRSAGQPVVDEQEQLVEYIGAIMDTTDRHHIERALIRARARGMRQRFQARLAERNRIAREMHDTLLQGFTGVALKLVAAAHRLTTPPELQVELNELILLAQRTLEDARRAIWEIREPLGGTPLAEAVRAVAEEVLRGKGVELKFDSAGMPHAIPEDLAAVVLRVTREAVTNAVQHADASLVSIRLHYRRHSLRLTISDNGRGFVVAEALNGYGGHWGLLGMRERACEVGARLRVRSAPRRGTTVSLTLPLSARLRDESRSEGTRTASV